MDSETTKGNQRRLLSALSLASMHGNQSQLQDRVNPIGGQGSHTPLDPKRSSSEVISGHQGSSGVISGHQWPSGVIRGHQGSSVAISGHQGSHAPLDPERSSSGVIRGRDGHSRLWIQSVRHQGSLEVISGHQWSSGVTRAFGSKAFVRPSLVIARMLRYASNCVQNRLM